MQRSKEPSEVLTKTTKPSHRLSIERLEKRYLRVWQIRIRIEEELRTRIVETCILEDQSAKITMCILDLQIPDQFRLSISCVVLAFFPLHLADVS